MLSAIRYPICVLVVAYIIRTGQCQPASVNEAAIKEVASGKRKVAHASWWGYDPQDATHALQSAINSGAKKVIVENMGTPWIVDKIQLASDQEVFFEKGVFVQAKRGAFKGTGDCLFTASLKKNVVLNGYGATFKMWKEDYHTKDYQKAEWRHALSIRSCDNVKVYGLTLASSGGDGIYLGVTQRGVTNSNVHIKDVICVDNNRQGISVISAENLLIENTILKDTWGTAPQAGIDFEPNEPSEKLSNIVMRNCVSENNRGDAYAFYIPTLKGESSEVSIRLENCRSVGCSRAVALTTGNSRDDAVKGKIDFVNCRLEGSEHAGIIINRKPVVGCRVRFENCIITDTAVKHPAQTPIIFMACAGDTEPIGGVAFVNCVVQDPVQRLPMSYMDASGCLPLREISGSLRVEHEGRKTTYLLDQKLLDTWMPPPVFRDIPPFETRGVVYAPAFPEAKPLNSGVCRARLRVHGKWLLWTRAGEEATFSVLIQPVGKVDVRPVKVRVVSPSGEELFSRDTQDGQETSFSFTATETGACRIVCDPGSFTAQVSSTTGPVCLYGEKSPLHFLSTTGEFFFWAPAGVKVFGVRVSGDNPGERVKAALVDPTGKVVEEKDNIAQAHQFAVEREEKSQGEIWSIRLSPPSQNVLEDFYVLLQGVPPVLACAREGLLKPRD